MTLLKLLISYLASGIDCQMYDVKKFSRQQVPYKNWTIFAILWLFRIQIKAKPMANTHHHNFAPVHSLVTEYLIVQKMVEVFLSAGYRLIQISLKLLYDGYVPVVA